MQILITGSRAPVALDLSRRFHQAGHTVIHADSLKSGIAKWSNSAARSFHVPRPVDDPRAYVEALAGIVEKHRIDWLIPTCEEVFFIAAHRPLLSCDVLIDRFETLSDVHNKWGFSQSAGNGHARPPKTMLIDEGASTARVEQMLGEESLADWVFKPVYSRFASRTLVGPTSGQLRQGGVGRDGPWIAQRRIRGVEYSTYSVAIAGQLRAHVVYRSLYRAGRGSGILFVPGNHPVIDEYIEEFVRSNGYTGQIGFDFIQDGEGRYWVLEANPRATSGLHLLDDNAAFIDVLVGAGQAPLENDGSRVLRPSTSRSAMVEFAMPFWGLRDAIRQRRLHRFLPDALRARCTTFSLADPWPMLALLPALAEIISIAWREKRTLQQASTFDIEWNGGPM